ncbi:MAG: aminoacyl-tRNA hydrolase [Candidatus Omnitrophota bacterium]
MKLIVGLGNPGEEYTLTRHNIGFLVVEDIARSNNLDLKKKKKFEGETGEGVIKGEMSIIFKPHTYMNLSGNSVHKLINWLSLDLNDLLVIFDDISLFFEDIRIRPKGSDGGHKGLRSIIDCLGTDEFSRIRVGIKGNKEISNYPRYVLNRFTKKEQIILPDIIKRTASACECWVKEGVEETMNTFNMKKLKGRN